MYDLKTKLSSKGKITEVLGNNTYVADCGSGLQHISGDVGVGETSKKKKVILSDLCGTETNWFILVLICSLPIVFEKFQKFT